MVRLCEFVERNEKVFLRVLIAFGFVTLALILACWSMLQHSKSNNNWVGAFNASKIGDSEKPAAFLTDWNQLPLVDIYATTTEGEKCPSGFEKDPIFKIQMGRRALCDCLNNGIELYVGLDEQCEAEDCRTDAGRKPKSVKFCGKRVTKFMKDMVRPTVVTGSEPRKYACPTGLEPCNGEWLDKPGGADYVICKRQGTSEKECPITSI